MLTVRDRSADPTWFPTDAESAELVLAILLHLRKVCNREKSSGLVTVWPARLRSQIRLWRAYGDIFNLRIAEEDDAYLRNVLGDEARLSEREDVIVLLTQKLINDIANDKLYEKHDQQYKHDYWKRFESLGNGTNKSCENLLTAHSDILSPTFAEQRKIVEKECLYAFGLAEILIRGRHQGFAEQFTSSSLLKAVSELILRFAFDAKETSDRLDIVVILMRPLLQTLFSYLSFTQVPSSPLHFTLTLSPLFSFLLQSSHIRGYNETTLSLLTRVCGHPEWSHPRSARLALLSHCADLGIKCLGLLRGLEDRLVHSILLQLSNHNQISGDAWQALLTFMSNVNWSTDQKQDALKMWRLDPLTESEEEFYKAHAALR